jgi:hypothetical protein
VPAWLLALDEESPRLFQTRHEADQENGRVVAFSKWNLKQKRQIAVVFVARDATQLIVMNAAPTT